jgi:hypothetical protein
MEMKSTPFPNCQTNWLERLANMARKKQIDPFMTGWFVEVISLGYREGYEWMLIKDQYISYRSESLSGLASARGKEWARDAALDVGWICQEVAEAIDSGTIRDISNEHIDVFIENCGWSGPMSQYVSTAIYERSRRTQTLSEYYW